MELLNAVKEGFTTILGWIKIVFESPFGPSIGIASIIGFAIWLLKRIVRHR